MDIKQKNVTVRVGDDATWEFVVCAGIVMPKEMIDLNPETGFADQLKQVKDLDLRDDDVILAAYPRSGTHWVWEITNMLLKGEAKYETVDKSSASLDFYGFDVMSGLPSPRVLNTHFLPRHLPRVVSEKRSKIVHVQRNVKDVVVSLYNILQENWPMMPELESFDTFLKYCTDYYGTGASCICTWTHHVKTWEEFGKQNPDQIINILYEDIIEDPVREIRRINDFLQCARCDELLWNIADVCSFAKLKEAHTKKNRLVSLKSAHRKGEVGDWKNTFTVAQNEFMDKWLENKLIDTDLKFIYTL